MESSTSWTDKEIVRPQSNKDTRREHNELNLHVKDVWNYWNSKTPIVIAHCQSNVNFC
jgi:hypothetical protein